MLSKKKNSTADALNQIVETKLSRADLTDLLISEIEENLEKERDQLQEAYHKLENKQLSIDAIIDMFQKMKLDPNNEKLRIQVSSYNRQTSSEGVRLWCEAYMEINDCTDEIKQRVNDQDDLLSRIDENRKKLNSVRNDVKKVKTALIRKALDLSEDGKKVLQLLDGVKVSLNEKLLK